MREELLKGLRYLEAVTLLLQRIRTEHHTAGLYEAADLQWWWAQRARPTDELGQLFWFDDGGLPGAAVIVTGSDAEAQLDPLVMPLASPELIARVLERGLAHMRAYGFETATIEVDEADDVLCSILVQSGFESSGTGVVETWLRADARPEVSPLHDGYVLKSRRESLQHPHHMSKRNGPDIGERLQQTSLYRDDLDLVIYDDQENVAAYGLFWYDPATATGLVEPMRTDDNHQRRGLARHILTTGVDRMFQAGATRIKICFEPDNPASSHLYLSTGFQPDRQTVRFTGPTSFMEPT